MNLSKQDIIDMLTDQLVKLTRKMELTEDFYIRLIGQIVDNQLSAEDGLVAAKEKKMKTSIIRPKVLKTTSLLEIKLKLSSECPDNKSKVQYLADLWKQDVFDRGDLKIKPFLNFWSNELNLENTLTLYDSYRNIKKQFGIDPFE